MARHIVDLSKPVVDRPAIINALSQIGEVEQLQSLPRTLFVVAPASARDAILAVPGVLACTIETPDDFQPSMSTHDFARMPMQVVGQMPLVIHGNRKSDRIFDSFYDLMKSGEAFRFSYDPTVTEGNGTGVNIYVVDGGIRPTHEEISGRFGSQLIDRHSDALGFHGLACASVAAGTDLGVAPGATIFDCKGFPFTGGAPASDAIAAIDAALTHFNANSQPGVVNCSFVGAAVTNAYSSVIDSCVDAGLVVVASSGNDSLDLDLTSGSDNRWPAEDPDAVTVGGLDSWLRVHPTGNHHGSVDIYAMFQMWTTPNFDADNSYLTPNRVRGTSFAAPVVTGMIARALTGTTKMTTRAQVESFVAQFLADYSEMDVVDIDGTPLTTKGRLYIPGVTRSGFNPYTYPTTGLS